MINIEGYEYELIEDYREAFQEEVFKERYSDILARYDYIVGDWGYNQLRLKGFFDDKNQKATFDTKISTLQDYLYEYCNFGCAFFVLRKSGKSIQQPEVVVSEASEVTKPVENERLAE
ncbi:MULTISPECIES: YutD family protein [Lysinibacillus]|uniref:YutD family protein n=1 Tax=Lysinibacillus TaxID=400634 RepID=UPI00083CA2EE|nr:MULTISPECIES: YutD family protein [Lysinibacillus]